MFWILSVYGCSYNRSFVGQTNWQKRDKNLEIKIKVFKKEKKMFEKVITKASSSSWFAVCQVKP